MLNLHVATKCGMQMEAQMYDIAVVGGGINGTGIAADAVGRGLSVILAEQADLAQATSSASSKLIHGGIRYLENLDFRLVRESLNEREILLQNAPHLVRPLRFIMPNVPSIRSPFLVRLGLFLYDHLSKKSTLPPSKLMHLTSLKAKDHLQPNLKKGFIYSDCTVDDSRLVVCNALAAKNGGARILTYTKCTSAERQKDLWRIVLASEEKQEVIYAKALVNATGPWSQFFLKQIGFRSNTSIKLVKGSHILVPKIYPNSHAYLLQHDDKRVVFVIPYLDKFSLIGTTDINYEGDLKNITISEQEVHYLCDVVNRYFTINLRPSDIIDSYSGVRPLINSHHANPAKLSRDYLLEISDLDNKLPLLSVFGGKITTYRKLAETALNKLQKYFPKMCGSWNANTKLPGGDIPEQDFQLFIKNCVERYAHLNEQLVIRYAKQYGTNIHKLLDEITCVQQLGHHFGCGLYAIEVAYLIHNEWVKTAEDILWRRTKLGYWFSTANCAELEKYITSFALQPRPMSYDLHTSKQ